MGLKKKTSKFLNVASGESFLHISTTKARKILDKILADKEPLEEDPLEEESQIAKPEYLPNPLQTSAIPIFEPSEKGENSNFRLHARFRG
jgi:hypothetical protein